MEKTFGDKYINPRKLLVEYSKQKMDKNTTEYNREKISKGMIPSDLADNDFADKRYGLLLYLVKVFVKRLILLDI